MAGFIPMDNLNTGSKKIEDKDHPVRHSPTCERIEIRRETRGGGWSSPTKYQDICQCGGQSEIFVF